MRIYLKRIFSIPVRIKLLVKILFYLLITIAATKFLIDLTKFVQNESKPLFENNPKVHWRPNAPKVIQHATPEKELVILIYGTYYGVHMMPSLVEGFCWNSTKHKIIRTTFCVPHDIVILYFTHYDQFVRSCVKSPEIPRKEPAWYTKTELRIQPAHRQSYHMLSESFHQESSIRTKYYLFNEKKNTVDWDQLFKEFNTRKKVAGSAISKCITPAAIRLEYINEVRKYFNIDGYGTCFGSKISEREYYEMLKKVMFYLSFENSVCDDYITEKYCYPIIFGAIPIVMAPPRNAIQLIPGSFINAFDFTSVKKLGEHLTEITLNFTLYKSYFIWKQNYSLTLCERVTNACEMVDKATQVSISGTSFEDGGNTLLSEENCMTIPQLRRKLFGND